MFLACPLKAILDSDSDLDGGDAMGKGRLRIKRKSAKNIDWPTYDDQASFNEEVGSKLQSLIQIVKYHLVDDDRQPAHLSSTISKVMNGIPWPQHPAKNATGQKNNGVL